MNIKKLTAIALLGLGLSLTAAAQVVSQAYEVALSDFRAPTTANSSVAFKECDSCEQQLVRVTERTRYMLNGKAVRLDEFRKALSQVSHRSNIPVIVLHHLESDTIKSIAVSLK